MQKDVRHLVNEFTHNTSLVLSKILWREFRLSTFNKLKPSTIPMSQLYSHLSGEIYQDASITATHLCIILRFILTK